MDQKEYDLYLLKTQMLDLNISPVWTKKNWIYFCESSHVQLKKGILDREIDDSSMRENKWKFWVQYLYAIVRMTQIQIQI